MSKYEIKPTSQFKKDVKLMNKRGCDLQLLSSVIDKLASGEKLSEKHKDHFLTGNYSSYKECHITPDWLLIYKLFDDELILILTRTGSHADLF